MSKHAIGILGTGSYLPKELVGNEEVARQAGVTAEWIERKTHISTRRHAAPDEASSDLAVKAAERALSSAGLSVAEIDYLILATSTPDFPQPPTSYLVQHRLGAENAACLDVNVVCSGFVYALELARGLVTLHPGARALVVAADVYSRIVDVTDRRTAVLFADGAGAAVVGAVPEGYGFLDTELTSRGDAHALIRIEAGGSRTPASHETVAQGGHFFRMNGRAVREFVAGNVPAALRRLLARAGLRTEDVDHFVPHQANGVMIADLVESSGLTKAHTHRTLERYGNVGAASIPVTLDEANHDGYLKKGDLVLLAGFGGGMALGTSLLRWGAAA
ncbi:3-oxoacyl-ACP synthase III family protein [Streptomyces hoynatensis]|uniref:Ketoacyl-ACP synthase III n=1 Tax=Streptomyces hoynatensis TaxID=1141874 RepID=A0A3A9ZFW2_9ACTN|nr:ketoacyl-ACP synthase III [Streptomyces hoynatensis]RKN47035.1 ketoacyl-ACP synthase III [Streptomyces hoynatensis]